MELFFLFYRGLSLSEKDYGIVDKLKNTIYRFEGGNEHDTSKKYRL